MAAQMQVSWRFLALLYLHSQEEITELRWQLGKDSPSLQQLFDRVMAEVVSVVRRLRDENLLMERTIDAYVTTTTQNFNPYQRFPSKLYFNRYNKWAVPNMRLLASPI